MEVPGRQSVTRRTYKGADALKPMRVSSMKLELIDNAQPDNVIDVPNLSHYESGCRHHRACFGHLCRTPSGAILPPQSMSMKNGPIVSEYLRASSLAFAGNNDAYIDALKRTNFTKHGTMRSIMSTPVAGSFRLIATPQWEFGRDVIAISRNLASRLRVCRIVVDNDGVQDLAYSEGELREGDWVIVGRPPSLSIRNTQPMKVRFWDADCAGIHPEAFSAFHGDFDGDELHGTPVYNPDSLVECMAWEVPPSQDFAEGRELFDKLFGEQCSNEHSCKFIEYSTISSKQMLDGAPDLVFGKVSRNKPQYVSGMHKRFSDPQTELSFIEQSVRGMADVCRQQLSQGSIGDMTRVAKVAAMCFFRPPGGGLYVSAKNGPKLLLADGIADPGSPAVRAVMAVCAVAQQAALDAHRVQESDSQSYDFVSDLVIGHKINSKPSANPQTLVIFNNEFTASHLQSLECAWHYRTGSNLVTLCRIRSIKSIHAKHIVGAYNPRVLTMCKNVGRSVVAVCFMGLRTVCNYYSLQISELELTDLSYVMSYQADKSRQPITSREGIVARDVSWAEKLMATDFTKVPWILGETQEPNTSTSAMLMNNFAKLTGRGSSDPSIG